MEFEKLDEKTLALLGDCEAQRRITKRGLLIPCPFCGEKDELSIKCVYSPLIKYEAYFIKCGICGCQSCTSTDEETAIHAWNSRVPIIKNFVGFEMSGWISVQEQLPEEGVIVITKIDDENGVRNIQKLTRKGNMWFLPDLSVYVYYRPTHWKSL